jgi:hypothetical protein
MGTLNDLKEWIGTFVRAPAQPPLWGRVGAERVDEPVDGARLVADGDYFQIRVQRIHLAYEREWFEKFAPVLLVATEFSYDGQDITRPSVIGPSMIEQLGRAAPLSTTIAGTVVAGPHPMRAGGLSVTVALYRVARGNVVAPFLNVVEGAASALDLTAGLVPYAALARVVVTGVTALAGGDKPLVARRDQFTTVSPAYFALISPVAKVDLDSLYVRAGELMELIGGRMQPFRQADYVLYSIDRVDPKDVDVTQLPLHRQWLTVLDEANKASTAKIWESTKTNLSTLISMAFASPDLTYGHAEALEREWVDKTIQRRDRARARGMLGGPPSGLDQVRTRALAVLDL